MISTVIVTYNEARFLKECITCVLDSDEIIIVDLGSTDETFNLLKDFKVKIFKHVKVDFVEEVRNFAVSKARGDWVLVLDPDERVTPTLWKRLKQIASEEKFSAVNIPRKNIFFGKWIAHSNWWPDYHVRFFKKGTVKWSDKIHLYPLVEGPVLNLPASENFALLHFGYKTIGQFIERQSRYSKIKAKNLILEGERFSWISFFCSPAREFLVRYIKHRGFLDGFYGFVLTYLMMIYQLQVQIALWELEKNK